MSSSYAPNEQTRRRAISQQSDDVSPFVLMGEILEKLKFLGYERDLIRKYSFRPFDAGQFAVQTKNPQEQFYYLRCTMEWLCDIAGQPFPDRAQMSDDINSSASTVSSHLRKLGCTSDTTPASLKPGYGEAACNALNFLCDLAMKEKPLPRGEPEFIEDGSQDNLVEEDNGAEDDEEIGDDDVIEDEDEPVDALSSTASEFGGRDVTKDTKDKGRAQEKKPAKKKTFDDDDDGFGFGDDDDDEDSEEDDVPLDRKRRGTGFGLGKGLLGDDDARFRRQQTGTDERAAVQEHRLAFAPPSKFDPQQWRFEAQRVAPQLKPRRGADLAGKDWYGRLEDTKQQLRALANARRTVNAEMTALVREIEAEMEKIRSRERYFNQDCRPLLEQYKKEAETLRQLQAEMAEQSKDYDELTQLHGEITDQLESVRSEIDMQSESSSDTGPLTRMKDSLVRLQDEIKQIGVRVATLQHYLLQNSKEELEKKKNTTTALGQNRQSEPSIIPRGEEEDDDEEMEF